ncbi:MAG: hypothetical protein QNK37_16510 [Acidobacteriota bacterium]|nr:hypothetical protein [Acidobacteriota bacterium]
MTIKLSPFYEIMGRSLYDPVLYQDIIDKRRNSRPHGRTFFLNRRELLEKFRNGNVLAGINIFLGRRELGTIQAMLEKFHDGTGGLTNQFRVVQDHFAPDRETGANYSDEFFAALGLFCMDEGFVDEVKNGNFLGLVTDQGEKNRLQRALGLRGVPAAFENIDDEWEPPPPRGRNNLCDMGHTHSGDYFHDEHNQLVPEGHLVRETKKDLPVA